MLQIARDCAVTDGVRKAATISSLEQNIVELQCLVGDCQGKIREDEMTRRTLHNRIQELKGSHISNTAHIHSNPIIFLHTIHVAVIIIIRTPSIHTLQATSVCFVACVPSSPPTLAI